MSVPVWARDRPREKPPVTVFSAPSETPPRGRETRGVRERGPSSKRSDDSSPRGDRAKLGKTTGVMAVGAWSAREEIARMIESGVPSSDILQAIRSGRESDDPRGLAVQRHGGPQWVNQGGLAQPNPRQLPRVHPHMPQLHSGRLTALPETDPGGLMVRLEPPWDSPNVLFLL